MTIPRMVTAQLAGCLALVIAMSSLAQAPPPPETLTNISSCVLQGSDVFVTTAQGPEARRYRYVWTDAIDALCNARGFAMPRPDRAGRLPDSLPSTAIAPAASGTGGGAATGVSLPMPRSDRSRDASELNGNWVAKFAAPNGAAREVKITFANGTGTFKAVARNPEDPCVGREFPVAVSNVTADGFALTVHGFRSLAGCPDFRWHPRRASAGGYEGMFPDGTRYVIVREQ